MPNNSLSLSAGALNTYQEGINMIANNLANAGSTAFKDQTLGFSDQVYQTIFAPSAPTSSSGGTDPIESGLGVKISSRNTDFSQGGIQSNGTNTNMAINGNGFFILGALNGTSVPSYTRNGTFTINQNGYLIDPASGKAVQGFNATAAGTLPSIGTSITNINIPIGLTTTATGTGFGTRVGPSSKDSVFDLVQGGNLDQSQYQATATGGVGTNQTLTTTIYDSLGGSHTATITYSPSGTVLPLSVQNTAGIAQPPATAWKMTTQFSDGTSFKDNAGLTIASGTPGTVGYAYFDGNGQFINSSGTSPTTAAGTALTAVHLSGTPASNANGNLLNIVAWPTGNNAVAPTTSAGPQTAAIAIDFSHMTSLAGTGEAVTTVSQNGFAQGTLTTFSVGQSGVITGAFTNGQQKTMGQLVIANFENLQGLESGGSSEYLQTAASGLVQQGLPNTGQFGNVIDNALEQSNVSVATEFTKLIVMQNAYLSNSKAITVSNQDLQAVNNLIA